MRLRTLLRHGWPGLLALAWMLAPPAVHAWGNNPPVPVATNSVCVFRFDLKVGPEAFAIPAGPWYSYFPVDPNLLAQPRASAFPSWPTQPPAAAPGTPPGLTYQAPPVYGYGAYPAGYYAPPGYGYGR